MPERTILELGIFLGGFLICLWHRRVSKWMWLLIMSMAAAVFVSIFRICVWARVPIVEPWQRGYALYFSNIWYAVFLGLFFTGLSIVLSAVKKREQYACNAQKLRDLGEQRGGRNVEAFRAIHGTNSIEVTGILHHSLIARPGRPALSCRQCARPQSFAHSTDDGKRPLRKNLLIASIACCLGIA
jgi:hypothetical protein